LLIFELRVEAYIYRIRRLKMSKGKCSLVLMLMLVALSACDKKGATSGGDSAASATSTATCSLVSTKDNNPLAIKTVATDTAEAKEFLSTCINPYTKLYAKDAEAAKVGKKAYAYNGCSGCHGGNANGLMGPSLIDAQWQYAKHTTDKGLFETVAGGTNGSPPDWGSMLVWHNQLPGKTGDGLDTDTILKILAWVRTQYTGGGETPWLN
jgi:cytochrome c-L